MKRLQPGRDDDDRDREEPDGEACPAPGPKRAPRVHVAHFRRNVSQASRARRSAPSAATTVAGPAGRRQRGSGAGGKAVLVGVAASITSFRGIVLAVTTWS